MTSRTDVKLSEVVGGGYLDFWNSRHRYRILKGGRASKKSKTAALNHIVRLMEYPGANLLCIRQTANTLYDSMFSDLQWAVNRLRVSHIWTVTKNPMRMRCTQNGNEIIFRGLDDPLKLTSITASSGSLCWFWIEEAFEIRDKSSFDKIDLSLRGAVPDGLFKQMTLTFNPWLANHWLFDLYNSDDPEVFKLTTTYLQNEFLDAQDISIFERIRDTQPERYKVEGLGEWGVLGDLVFQNIVVEPFDDSEFDNWREGIDWGFSVDPFAWIACHYDRKRETLYICDEVCQTNLRNKAAAELVKQRTHGGLIMADSAEPKSVAEFRDYGVRIRAAKKGPGSIESGIKWLQSLDMIVIHPRCKNAQREFLTLHYLKDRFGQTIPKIEGGNEHLVDAARYATEDDHRTRAGVLQVRGI